jgi:hypothetical protein
VPVVVLFVPVLAIALVLGALITGGGRRAFGAVGVAAGASVVAVVLHIPWSFDFALPGSDWWSTGGVAPMTGHAIAMGDLLRFHTGLNGLSSVGWALPIAAALPLFIGREWRFGWAVRCWTVALTCWALAWAAGQGLLGVPLPPPDVLLAPAAAALSLSVGLGVVAFERDLRGYHFGWRQVASLIAAAAVAVCVVPVLIGSIGGRWDLPRGDHASTLSFLRRPELRAQGGFRVLWLGDPAVLPVAGFRLSDDLAYGLSEDGPGTLTERWAAPAYGSTTLVPDALRLATNGDTDRIGRMLGPLGIRYVVLAERAAPARDASPRRPLPPGLAATVARQLDLRRLDVDPALTFYENTSWVPVRAHLAEGTSLGGDPLRASSAVALSDAATPVLTSKPGHARYTGAVPSGTAYVAESAASGWHLTVGGRAAPRARALGWASSFEVAHAGDGTLSYRTSPLRWGAVLLQLVLWAGAVVIVVGRPRRRRKRELP